MRPWRSLAPNCVSADGSSDLGKRDALLPLVLAAAVLVRHLADLVGLEEDHLGHTFVGVDLRRKRRGVRELERHVPFPLGLERRHVDDDAAARVRRLSQAHDEHVAWYAEKLDSARQRKRVGWNDA